ncbi:MAG: hypothetical protein RMK99_09245 [Anaerolineales bacterium]|nr:hypothetical protein [Anaerolineales bacterium]
MPNLTTVENGAGGSWTVEHDESDRLTHIGGFLLTYRTFGSITLAARLNHDEKVRGTGVLLQRLATIPPGRSTSYLWHPDDK